MTSPDPQLAQALEQCRTSREFLSELSSLLSSADAEIAAQGWRCMGGGACCRFDLAGHRLYVSTGELALLTAARGARPQRALGRRCPWQRGPRCLARDARPLGCRAFFCQADEKTSQLIYERFHSQIRQLHEEHRLEYRYVELTWACISAGASGGE